MATTYNFTDGSIAGVPRMTQTTLRENELTILRHIVDFSLQNIEAGAADVAQCLIIPAATTVLTAYVRVMTAETANGTVDLGYGGNADQWGDALDVAAAADVTVGGLGSNVPVYFAAADTIDLTATTDGADVDLDGLKVEVFAVCLKHVDTY
jgi:hypothetical protein